MVPNYVRDALSLTIYQFFDNTTLNGFKFGIFLNQCRKSWRSIPWFLILFGVFIFTIYVVQNAWASFMLNPTITAFRSDDYPVDKIAFPSVAVCNVNKLSRMQVYLYALKLKRQMSKMSVNHTDLVVIRESIRSLGNLMGHSPRESEEDVQFQTYLETYDASETQFYDVKSKLQMLSPKCSENFVKCQWLGTTQNCTDLFKLEATPEGFCCIFNYKTPSHKYSKFNPTSGQAKGMNNGLVILLNTSTHDYYFNDKNINGYFIKLFHPKNFPDLTSGETLQFVVNPLEEISAKLSFLSVTAEEAIRDYAPEKRRCYFSDEKDFEYGFYYSQSNCLSKCKFRSINALCNCLPFYVPEYLWERKLNTPDCSLEHLKCLSRYKNTWNMYRPEKVIFGLEKEMEDALSCPGCLPLCEATYYKVDLTASALKAEYAALFTWGILEDIDEITDVSLVRIYFGGKKSNMYEIQTIFVWFEIIGFFGGLLGLCLGFSIISVSEIVYFFTVKFYENIKTCYYANTVMLHEQKKYKRTIFE